MSIISQSINTNSTAVKKLFFKEGEELVSIILFSKIILNQLNACKKCEELWDEMRKADFRQEGFLNDKNIQLIYEKKKSIIEDLLKISTAEEFLEVFDDDMVRFQTFYFLLLFIRTVYLMKMSKY